MNLSLGNRDQPHFTLRVSTLLDSLDEILVLIMRPSPYPLMVEELVDKILITYLA
jgi:hypothetical protein